MSASIHVPVPWASLSSTKSATLSLHEERLGLVGKENNNGILSREKKIQTATISQERKQEGYKVCKKEKNQEGKHASKQERMKESMKKRKP